MYVGVSHMNVYFVREAGAGGLQLLAWAPGRKADKVLSGLRCSNFFCRCADHEQLPNPVPATPHHSTTTTFLHGRNRAVDDWHVLVGWRAFEIFAVDVKGLYPRCCSGRNAVEICRPCSSVGSAVRVSARGRVGYQRICGGARVYRGGLRGSHQQGNNSQLPTSSSGTLGA